ncbi:hypothetical protein COX00_01255 [Candidatus Uhrbacteria bacterium CG22_combo_CG10-13_8_21_14_all_47_17]|uniref:Uncharacterized protein n=1 Tax=Candidatus Uhrbacteria bacterium CG22_combo_CG10-13_8_21_14_all_47_17 TaxID=1975041 RepID=A0A2H0BT00_9BACT|nr:MAG: hypothetical protein COX00_01255 [Candidatus Uhrbacteria bacterium CG22_combo_CG10-13_8_21_14_all_47_17]
MSWQRILETARRNGFPVVVTDIAGREPMVVMPLDAYEALSSQKEKNSGGFDDQSYSVEVGGSEIRTVEPILDEFNDKSFENVGATMPEMEEKKVLHVEEAQKSDDEELALEDRFFLEPTESQLD